VFAFRELSLNLKQEGRDLVQASFANSVGFDPERQWRVARSSELRAPKSPTHNATIIREVPEERRERTDMVRLGHQELCGALAINA